MQGFIYATCFTPRIEIVLNPYKDTTLSTKPPELSPSALK